jgi:hypothetical protein
MSGFIFARFLLWEVIPTSLVLFHFRAHPAMHTPCFRPFVSRTSLTHTETKHNVAIRFCCLPKTQCRNPFLSFTYRVFVRHNTIPAQNSLGHH